jgi:hypothetical protein
MSFLICFLPYWLLARKLELLFSHFSAFCMSLITSEVPFPAWQLSALNYFIFIFLNFILLSHNSILFAYHRNKEYVSFSFYFWSYANSSLFLFYCFTTERG